MHLSAAENGTILSSRKFQNLLLEPRAKRKKIGQRNSPLGHVAFRVRLTLKFVYGDDPRRSDTTRPDSGFGSGFESGSGWCLGESAQVLVRASARA